MKEIDINKSARRTLANIPQEELLEKEVEKYRLSF
jgi:hypothetical protein